MCNVGLKTNRMNFLNGVSQRSKFFLPSFLETHLVLGKGGMKLYCELGIGMCKKIIPALDARHTNMRKYNCGKIIKSFFSVIYDTVYGRR